MKKILMYMVCLGTMMCLCACSGSIWESGNAKKKTQESENVVTTETKEQHEKRLAKEFFDVDLDECKDVEVVNNFSEKEFEGKFQVKFTATKQQYDEIKEKNVKLFKGGYMLLDKSEKASEFPDPKWQLWHTFYNEIEDVDEYFQNKDLYYFEKENFDCPLTWETPEPYDGDPRNLEGSVIRAFVIDNGDETYEIWMEYWK